MTAAVTLSLGLGSKVKLVMMACGWFLIIVIGD